MNEHDSTNEIESAIDIDSDNRDEAVVFKSPTIDIGSMQPNEATTTLLTHAVQSGASDLFLLTDEYSATVAMRRLGSVETVTMISKDQVGQLIRYLKTQAGMDIAETRRPLDGRYLHEADGLSVDIRINAVPTLYGVDLSCRLLDRSTRFLSIEDLGLFREDESKLKALLNSPGGLVLVTGPTGTGKTTTIYACLQFLNDGARKINTIEDPIEYSLKGIRQSPVNSRLGVSFSDLLPSILRQSPDVILVGEIVDQETAKTAVRAANSGHLVLAALHAPRAAGAVQSMIALEVHPHFLASCILAVIAQRLIRVLRPESRIPYDISQSPETFRDIESLLRPGEGSTMYGPDPSDEMSQGGYSGRTGLFEVMQFNHQMRRIISERRPAQEIQEAAIRNGLIEFRRGALLKVAQGVTSMEEMLRVVPIEYLGVED